MPNIMANPRAELAYVVEEDDLKWETFKAKWNLKDDVKFLKPNVG